MTCRCDRAVVMNRFALANFAAESVSCRARRPANSARICAERGRHVRVPATARRRPSAVPVAVRVRRRRDRRLGLLEQRHQHRDQRVDHDDRVLAHAHRLPGQRYRRGCRR